MYLYMTDYSDRESTSHHQISLKSQFLREVNFPELRQTFRNQPKDFAMTLPGFCSAVAVLCLLSIVDETYAGVTIETITKGDGVNFPKNGQTVSVHYTGTLLADGKKFDSSRDRGQPFSFVLGAGQVIRGYDEAIPQMSLGQRAALTFTPDFAYGDRGVEGVIPPNASLVFDVEILSFK